MLTCTETPPGPGPSFSIPSQPSNRMYLCESPGKTETHPAHSCNQNCEK